MLLLLAFLVKFRGLANAAIVWGGAVARGKGCLMNGWILFLIVFTQASSPGQWPKGPIASATSAVFATEQACNTAGQELRQHFGEKLTWLCEPQSR
jgi:hypothetical protein